MMTIVVDVSYSWSGTEAVNAVVNLGVMVCR